MFQWLPTLLLCLWQIAHFMFKMDCTFYVQNLSNFIESVRDENADHNLLLYHDITFKTRTATFDKLIYIVNFCDYIFNTWFWNSVYISDRRSIYHLTLMFFRCSNRSSYWSGERLLDETSYLAFYLWIWERRRLTHADYCGCHGFLRLLFGRKLDEHWLVNVWKNPSVNRNKSFTVPKI